MVFFLLTFIVRTPLLFLRALATTPPLRTKKPLPDAKWNRFHFLEAE
jgi:hypothetical protein